MGKNNTPLKGTALLIGLIPLSFIFIFFFFPLGSIIQRGFTANSFGEVWTSLGTWKIFWFTFWQAVLSVLFTLILAFPMAYVLGRLKFKGDRLLSTMLVVPFVLPTLVVASAFLALQDWLGIRGFLHHSIWVILLAHVFFNFALVSKIVGGQWANLDPRLEQAARVLGTSNLKVFYHVTLPRLRASIYAAMGLVFFFSFTSFGVILVLGGPARATLDTEIWRYAVNRLDFQTAAALALLQILVVGIMAYFNFWSGKHVPYITLGVENKTPPSTNWQKITFVLTLGIAFILLVLPIISMVVESFTPKSKGFSFDSYTGLFNQGVTRILFVEPAKAIWNSLLYAGMATLIAVSLALCIAILAVHSRYYRLLVPLFLIPLGVSSVALGFGYLVGLDKPPLDLRTEWYIVPIIHSLIGMPFVLRPVLTQLRSINEGMRWSATMLGASPIWRFIKVELPMVSGAILTGAGFAFAISLGEFGASSFLARPNRPTIPLAIFRLLAQPSINLYGQAMALSVILILLLGIVIFVLDRFRSQKHDIGASIL